MHLNIYYFILNKLEKEWHRDAKLATGQLLGEASAPWGHVLPIKSECFSPCPSLAMLFLELPPM